MHFFRAPNDENKGDLVFFQGHSAPGVYARAFLEGRISEDQLKAFRQEALDENGLSSYPHPWLMPNYEVSRKSRHPAATGSQGLGLHGRWRDGRAGIAGCDFTGDA
jgi:pyruvate dehydrogenase complex dehydrogenase (E1) component